MASITITSPTGTSNFVKGTTNTISWSKSTLSGTWGNVSIDLYRDGSYVKNIVQNLSGSVQSYSWSVPSNDSDIFEDDGYQVRVITSHDDDDGGDGGGLD